MDGDIGYFNLEDWWLNELTSKERKIIEKKYTPISSDTSSCSLTKGKVAWSSNNSKLAFLTGIASFLNKPEDYTLSKKILKYAERFISETKDILCTHFYYQNCIQIHYKNRDKEINALSEAIEACKKQISISEESKKAFQREFRKKPLPIHVGYKQLAIILDKQKKYDELIQLCEQAKEQGWNENWDKRIEKAKNKLNK